MLGPALAGRVVREETGTAGDVLSSASGECPLRLKTGHIYFHLDLKGRRLIDGRKGRFTGRRSPGSPDM